MQVVMKPVSSLRPWDYCTSLFRDLPDREFQELVKSVAEHGVLVPVAVRPDGLILCGHQRVRAATAAGLSEVPCVEVVLPGDDHYRLYAIDDNIHRRHMSPVERARIFVERKGIMARLREAGEEVHGRVRDAAAAPIGITGRQAAKYEAIYSLPDDVKEMVESGKIGIEAAAALARVRDPEVVRDVARRAASGQLTTREVKKIAKESSGGGFHGVPRDDEVPAEARARIGALLGGLGQLVELTEIPPKQIVAACMAVELSRLADLSAAVEGWLRSLRREIGRELALRQGARAG